MKIELLPQGTMVEYEIIDLKGRGKIVGYSTILPVSGVQYIVENQNKDEVILEGTYDYSSFICPECYIKSIYYKI